MKELIEEEGIICRTMILSQDATMQHRMEASVKKYMPGVQVINYAVYDAKVVVRNGELTYEKEIWGMWDIERYLTLLLGDVQRLSDNEDGYGPEGKGYMVHVDVPFYQPDLFSGHELLFPFIGCVYSLFHIRYSISISAFSAPQNSLFKGTSRNPYFS